MQSSTSRWGKLDPMSGDWPMVFVDLLVVVGLAALGRWAATFGSSSVTGWIIFIGTVGALVMGLVALPLRILLMQQRSESSATTEALRLQNERQDFDARLGRALEMTDSETVALTTTARALSMCGDGLNASILLADNSDAHLQTVVTTAGCAPESSARWRRRAAVPRSATATPWSSGPPISSTAVRTCSSGASPIWQPCVFR